MRYVLPLLAVPILAFAPAPRPKPNPSEKDLKAMEGFWEKVEMHYPGVRDYNPGLYVFVKKNRTLITDERLILTNPWSVLTINARRKPKQITIKSDHSSFLGIYRLEGNTLTILGAYSDTEHDRPKAFTNFDTAQHHLEIWKRRSQR